MPKSIVESKRLMKIHLFPFLLFLSACGSYFPHSGKHFPTKEGVSRNECYFRVNRGYVVRWKNLPIPVYIHKNVNSTANKNILYAIDIWNQSWHFHTGKGSLFEPIGPVNQNVPDASGDGINLFFMDNKLKLLSSTQQGTTFIRHEFGGSIYDADIIINNIHFDYFYENDSFDYTLHAKGPVSSYSRSLASSLPSSFWSSFISMFKALLKAVFFWKKPKGRSPDSESKISKQQIDFISLTIHELGHLSGLVHIDPYTSSNSIMNPELSRGAIRRDIKDQELNYLACHYY